MVSPILHKLAALAPSGTGRLFPETRVSDYYLFAGRLFIAVMYVLSGANKLLFFSHGLD